MIQLEMPWPPSELRPNRARTRHWSSNGATAAKYKADCSILCRAAGVRKVDLPSLHLTLEYQPPTRRRYDMDGNLSASKAMIDAISQAVGIDDYFFEYTLLRGELVKGGAVLVTITEGE